VIQQDTLLQSQQLHVGVLVENVGFEGNIRAEGYPSSVTLFIIFGLALYAVIMYNFGKNVLESILSLFNYRRTLRMFEERRESDRQAAMLSNIMFSLVVGIFVSIVLPFFGAKPLWGSYALSILFFSIAANLLYTLKARVWKLLGAIFVVQTYSGIYVNSMFLYNHITGLILFPLVAIIPYIAENPAPYVIYIVIALFVISYFLKIFRIFQIIHSQNVSLFYFILYLCSLEFLPLLLFIKSCKMLSVNIVV